MNKLNVTNAIKSFKYGVEKYSPEILTGFGIAGFATTTVLAVKATPKALQLIDEKKMEIFDDMDPRDIPGNNVDYHEISLKPIEVIKTAWKPYIPAVITGVASTACLIGANSVNAKRNAALATAYKLSEAALVTYKEKVIETIGEKKEQEVRKKVAQNHIDEAPAPSKEIVVIGGDEVLFLDAISKRYFKSTVNEIDAIVNKLNADMVTGEPYISLSQFYDEVGLSHTANSDEIGWSLFHGGTIQIDYTPGTTDDNKPCFVLDYMVRPRYDFDRLL